MKLTHSGGFLRMRYVPQNELRAPKRKSALLTGMFALFAVADGAAVHLAPEYLALPLSFLGLACMAAAIHFSFKAR